MKGIITKRILETLAGVAMTSVALSTAILSSGYGASRKQIERKTQEIEDLLMGDGRNSEYKKQRHNFHSMLFKLKKEGFIKSEGENLKLTRLGKARLIRLDKTLHVKKYLKEKDDTLKIIMFDVPEKYKSKREWLRKQILDMGFISIQKSVFIGKFKLPREFIADLEKAKLFNHTEILAVSRTGSLKSLT